MKNTQLAALVLVVGVAGLAVGFGATSALTEPDSPPPATSADPRPSVASTLASTVPETVAPTTSAPPTSAPTSQAPATTQAPAPPILLAWTAGGLPDELSQVVESTPGLGRFAVVYAESLPVVATYDADNSPLLNLTDGFRIELDVVSVDPAEYAPLVDDADRAAVAELGEDEALLTASSSVLRSMGTGGSVVLTGGRTLQVVGVISDQSGSGAELVVAKPTGDRLGLTTPRFLLSRLEGDRVTVEEALRAALGTVPVRVRVTGESPFLRHGDAVLTQAAIKLRFGEFSFRDIRGSRDIEIDPIWREENIVDAEVPILGTVRCHRLFVDTVRETLTELQANDLGHLVDPRQYAGCFGPRRIGPAQPLSHHSWGVALDLNIGANPRGNFSTQDPRLVETMEAAGLAWGGHWLVPDPGHYEFIVER